MSGPNYGVLIGHVELEDEAAGALAESAKDGVRLAPAIYIGKDGLDIYDFIVDNPPTNFTINDDGDLL